MKGVKLRKKVLAIILGLIVTLSVSTLAYKDYYGDIKPRAYMWELTYYGTCRGPGIHYTYSYEAPMGNPIVKTERRLVIGGYDPYFDEFQNPIVVYRYIDTEGNIVTPYWDYAENKSKLRRNEGYDGPCPASTNWE